MSNSTVHVGIDAPSRWSELWKKEDWWAIWIGITVVLVGGGLFLAGLNLRWLAVLPPRWSSISQIGDDLLLNWPRYLAQFAFWATAFSVALRALGYSVRAFLPAFALLYVVAYGVFVAGQWENAAYYSLEPPLLALAVGLLVANTVGLPSALAPGFRGELYVKTGIVLLGATVPISLILLAGPIAILQASIVSLVTFFVIYWAAVKFGLDKRFAATLGVGGAVCGVSAAIAVAGAVGAKKEHTAVTITAVVTWAIFMIFALPFASRLLGLPTGVAGAWIGTSEFADAAGIAAAQAYGGLAGKVEGIAGTPEQALQAFTLVKVIGRDVWLGIWAVALAIVATTRWEAHPGGSRPDVREIWRRFPKFVLGFFIASIIVTLATAHYSLPDYNKIAIPGFIGPIKDLRSWAFIFCFLSIGVTTRFRDLAGAGRKPFAAFSVGVAVNVVLGFILCVYVFADHWAHLGE
jgi:uncharacterized membrane protein YadS